VETASIAQNDTHTVLRFVRPLQPDDPRGVLLHPHEDAFTMFLYAVGESNTLGYHALRGKLSADALLVGRCPSLEDASRERPLAASGSNAYFQVVALVVGILSVQLAFSV